MEAFPGVTPLTVTINFASFVVGDADTEYTLHVSGFTGDCSNSFAYSNGMRFTTFDNDNDLWSGNCALLYPSGWWHNKCHNANLNGRYFQPGEYSFTHTLAQGIHWHTCWYFHHSAKSSVMNVRLN